MRHRASFQPCAYLMLRVLLAHNSCATHPPRAATPQGTLRGYDQATNLILADARERVYSAKAGVEELPLGLYCIRGDNV